MTWLAERRRRASTSSPGAADERVVPWMAGDPSASAAGPNPLERSGAETFAGDTVIDDHHSDAE